MGNWPSRGADVVGNFHFNNCKGCGPQWNDCCMSGKPPSGPEWEAAKPTFLPLLEEAYAICDKNNGCCPSIEKMKTDLEADWTAKANEALHPHGLKVEICAFYQYSARSCPDPCTSGLCDPSLP